MAERPTLHLTNFPSRSLHGPGALLTIMAQPRKWERGVGSVSVLCPPDILLAAVRSGHMGFDEYAGKLRTIWSGLDLSPGKLRYLTSDGRFYPDVEDGDSLCCGCAKGAPCHRVVAAPFLVAAGWRVVLDGVDVTSTATVTADTVVRATLFSLPVVTPADVERARAADADLLRREGR